MGGHNLMHRPARFKAKQLLSPSTCPVHPKYQALRPPTSIKEGCLCLDIYLLNLPHDDPWPTYVPESWDEQRP